MTTALHRQNACAGVLGVAGAILSKNEDLKSRPPICMIHGTNDQIVPYIAMRYSEKKLQDFQCHVQTHAIQNLGHVMDGQVADLGKAFLKKFSYSDQNSKQDVMLSIPSLDDLSPDSTQDFLMQMEHKVQALPPEKRGDLFDALKLALNEKDFSIIQIIDYTADILIKKEIQGAIELHEFIKSNRNNTGGLDAFMPELITRALSLMTALRTNNLTNAEAQEYLLRNPDLNEHFNGDIEKAKQHWCNHGLNEGRPR